MKRIFVIAAMAASFVLPGTASAVVGVDRPVLIEGLLATATKDYARLTDSNVLLTDVDLNKAQLTNCQPLKGDVVLIMDMKSSIAGMPSADMAHVTVANGRCKGKTGWIGISRLESFQTQ